MQQLEMFSTGATRYAVNVVKRRQNMHANSLAAHAEEEAKQGRRANLILQLLKSEGRPMTDRAVMDALKFTDMNAVRPRITELIDAGLVREVGTVIDYVTGKKVRIVSCS